MTNENPAIDETTEWRRSNPDIVVYRPKRGESNDGDNEHFLVFPSPKSDDLLAMWTQSSVEAHGDNHIVLARSNDGVNWSEPIWVAGTHKDTEEDQASWGFPAVSRGGRIYCFFAKSPRGTRGGASGTMGCYYSDDDGRSWNEGTDTVLPSTRKDPGDLNSEETGSFIVWQMPFRDGKDRLMAGYTHWSKEKEIGSLHMMRFDNIDESPDCDDLKITWLPEGGKGIMMPRYVAPTGCEEPGIVLLPDGRLFTSMRTYTGYVWYSVSDSDGRTWRDTEVLRYRDNGDPVKHPLAPCPIYRLRDGRYFLLFHNNDYHARNQLFGDPMPELHPIMTMSSIFAYRRPAFITVGEFRPDAHQPIWFSNPKQILDTEGIAIGPKRDDEIATYTSFTDYKGKQILWYPDRKYYLLGKYISDEILKDMAVE